MKKIILLPFLFSLLACNPKDQILYNGSENNSLRARKFDNGPSSKPETYANMGFLLQRNLEAVKVIRWALDPKLAEKEGVKVIAMTKSSDTEPVGFSLESSEKVTATTKHVQKNFALIASRTFDANGKLVKVVVTLPMGMKKFENKVISQENGKDVDIFLKNKMKTITIQASKFPVEGAQVYTLSINSIDEISSAAIGRTMGEFQSTMDLKTLNGLEDLITQKEVEVLFIRNDLTRIGRTNFNLNFQYKGSQEVKVTLGDCVNFVMNASFTRADESGGKNPPKPILIKSDESSITFAEKVVMPLQKCEERAQEDMSLLFN